MSANRHGFAFRTLVSNQETAALLENPDVWHPIKSAFHGARWAGRAIARQHALLAELARDENAVLVAYPPVFAARLVQEKQSRPLASVVPMPWMIPSVLAPPTMPSSMNLPRWAPRPVVRCYWRLLEAIADLLIGRHLNRVRRLIGLEPVRRINRWAFSRHLTIGLFPAWYAPPQPDWPPNTRLAGFPLFDGGTEDGLPQSVLEFCRGGKPPIAFTFGTGMMHGARLFRAAVEACTILDARGILLTKFDQQLPVPLPPSIHYCEYAPFRSLFPLCAAVVHHGGVGTTAQALAAGAPQLILPLAWDQPDNAARVRRLGVGNWVMPDRSGARIASALSKLMTPATQVRCRAVADQFGKSDALETAAQFVEQLAEMQS
jgi:rhamnosyltransferase subunit B